MSSLFFFGYLVLRSILKPHKARSAKQNGRDVPSGKVGRQGHRIPPGGKVYRNYRCGMTKETWKTYHSRSYLRFFPPCQTILPEPGYRIPDTEDFRKGFKFRKAISCGVVTRPVTCVSKGHVTGWCYSLRRLRRFFGKAMEKHWSFGERLDPARSVEIFFVSSLTG